MAAATKRRQVPPVMKALTRAAQEQPQKNKDTGQRDLMAGAIRQVGEGNDGRTFELSFSSEEPYARWFGPEILDHSDGCVDMQRLQEIGVLLFNHDRDVVVGKITRAWVEGNRGKAIVEFDDDEASERVCKKVRSGTLKGVSVGYQVTNWEHVEAGEKSIDGRFTGPADIAKRWMPFEISIVSVPADATVGVGREFESAAPAARSPALTAYYSVIKNNEN